MTFFKMQITQTLYSHISIHALLFSQLAAFEKFLSSSHFFGYEGMGKGMYARQSVLFPPFPPPVVCISFGFFYFLFLWGMGYAWAVVPGGGNKKTFIFFFLLISQHILFSGESPPQESFGQIKHDRSPQNTKKNISIFWKTCRYGLCENALR